jgi:hypothetical protein
VYSLFAVPLTLSSMPLCVINPSHAVLHVTVKITCVETIGSLSIGDVGTFEHDSISKAAKNENMFFIIGILL